MRDHYPFVSVIICSKNRHDLLLKAVDSVVRCDYAPDKVEIIVVEESEKPLPVEGVKYVYLPPKNLGLGYTRNRGIANAFGEIIAFTDDDVIASKEWLKELVFTFEDPEVMGVAGLVRTQRGSAVNETEEILGLPGGGLKALERSGGKIVATGLLSTCNLAYRKRVFDEFSFLETSFGKFGGEDWFLGKQVSGKYKTVFNPKAVIYHKPKATLSRLVHTYYRRQLTDYMGRRDLENQSKLRAIFGKMHRCAILRAAAALLIVLFFKTDGFLFIFSMYYLLSLLSISGLWRHVNSKMSFFLYPFIKLLTELGILKGEIMILFASEKEFDRILENY
jgi:glycosyltransferase involved in cell wall biosynthesis